jgi:hypothetical protein
METGNHGCQFSHFAVAAKYGAPEIALKVAQMVDESGSSLLPAFLDNLSHNVTLSQEHFIVACTDIQTLKIDLSGKKDPRFIIPAVAIMKRAQLVQRLAEFVGATDTIFKAALAKMSEPVGRHSQVCRDETEQNTVAGMTNETEIQRMKRTYQRIHNAG